MNKKNISTYKNKISDIFMLFTQKPLDNLTKLNEHSNESTTNIKNILKEFTQKPLDNSTKLNESTTNIKNVLMEFKKSQLENLTKLNENLNKSTINIKNMLMLITKKPLENDVTTSKTIMSDDKIKNSSKEEKSYYNFALVVTSRTKFGKYKCNPKVFTFPSKLSVDSTIFKEFIKIKCNSKTYYISKFEKVDMYTSPLICQKYGLFPGAVLSASDISCLAKALNRTSRENSLIHTSVYDVYFNRTFMTCPGLQIIPSELWALGEPNNEKEMEPCAAINLCIKCQDFGYKDISCNRNHPFICQDQTDKKFDVKKPQYLKVYADAAIAYKAHGCNKSFLFSLKYPSKEKAKEYREKNFVNISCTNKTYYMTKRKISGMNIYEECVKARLVVGEVYTYDELLCISNFKKSSGSFKLHTNLWDVFLNRTFMTCPGFKRVSPELWAKNEPNNGNNMERCGAIDICTKCNNFGVFDHNGIEQFNLLCQIECKNKLC